MKHSILFAVALATTAALAFGQQDWSRFRGPDGAGIATSGAALPARFGPDENLLWKCEIDSGLSSPCLVGDRVFITGANETELSTYCIDRVTGELLWKRSVEIEAPERMHRINSAAAATPTSDGERVYVFFGSFGLVAYDFDGDEVWWHERSPRKNTFGSAASPIIAGDFVILVDDTNEGSWIEAIERESGETVWKTAREGFGSGWSTPTVWRRGDVDELLVLGVWWLTAYDLSDGSVRWSVPGLTDEPIITPVTGDGLVYVSSYNMNTNTEVVGLPDFEVLLEECDANGDGVLSSSEANKNVSVLSRNDAAGEGDHPLRIFFRFLDVDGDGSLTESEWQKIFDWLGGFEHENALLAIRPLAGDNPAEIVWQHARGVPECPSPLYYDGRIYAVKNGGIVTCLDAQTGELKYEGRLDSRGPCYASPVAGDGKIFSASARGVVTVFAAGDELRILAHNDLGERIMSTPALGDGKVFVRSETTLWAFGE